MNVRLIRFFTVFILLTASFHSLFAQADKDLVDIADETYNFGDKIDALDQYKLAVDINPNNLRANLMAGVVYLETINKDQGLKYLLKAYELDSSCRKDILFLIAQAYHFGEDFDNAEIYYNRYKNVVTKGGTKKADPKVILQIDVRIAQCATARKLISSPKNVEISSLGKAINTYHPEYGPVISSDEQMLIFTSKRSGGMSNDKDVTNEYFEDIYISRLENGEWTKAKNIGEPINTKGHDASIGLSADGKTLFIYKDLRAGDIYFSNRNTDDTWSKPEPMAGNINSSYAETSVSLTADGNQLFFSSNREGGIGGFDIYTSMKDKKGNWASPKNIGKEINTSFDEESPFIAADGKTLYFSSRGHEGMGGYDIYKSVYNEKTKKWSKPENLGYPINSVDDDIYFVIAADGLNAYYSSVKESGEGEKDIFKILLDPKKSDERRKLENLNKSDSVLAKDSLDPNVDPLANAPLDPSLTKEIVSKEETTTAKVSEPLPREPVTIKASVKDLGSGELTTAKVTLQNINTGTPIRLMRSPDGSYELRFTPDKKGTYRLTAEKEGYMFKSIDLVLDAAGPEPKTEIQEIGLQPLKVGLTSVLRNIYFDFDAATLKEESNAEIRKIERMMKENSSMKVQISGHTDKVGSPEYNLDLSSRRARSVMNALIERGVEPSRIEAVGYGEERPLASNDDEPDGREINRRTEFQILQK